MKKNFNPAVFIIKYAILSFLLCQLYTLTFGVYFLYPPSFLIIGLIFVFFNKKTFSTPQEFYKHFLWVIIIFSFCFWFFNGLQALTVERICYLETKQIEKNISLK